KVKDDILHEKLLNINFLIACDLPSSDDFSPISIFEEKSVTFSNPLFDSNDDFTSSDNESLSDEDVPEDVKIYSNPLFEFDDEYISSDVNPLFDEVLEDIECKDSYDSNLDESTFLVTPLSDSNEDECLAPSDDIELLLHHDPSISVVSILEGFTDEPPLEENDDLFDLESKENDWKKILYDAPIDDLITEDKVFNPEIHKKKFSYIIPSGEIKVTDIAQKDKNEAKRTKPGTGIKRVQEIEAEGEFILIHAGNPEQHDWLIHLALNPRVLMIDLEAANDWRVRIGGLGRSMKA
ncbi:hypothetical protein Tco_0268014, partial [Tanacetum coccineum]